MTILHVTRKTWFNNPNLLSLIYFVSYVHCLATVTGIAWIFLLTWYILIWFTHLTIGPLVGSKWLRTHPHPIIFSLCFLMVGSRDIFGFVTVDMSLIDIIVNKYIYIYLYHYNDNDPVCCVFISMSLSLSPTYIHTHTYIHTYIHTYTVEDRNRLEKNMNTS